MSTDVKTVIEWHLWPHWISSYIPFYTDMRDIVYVRRIVDLLKTTNFKVNACMYIIYTVSHFSYAPLIKCKITGKRNIIFSYSETISAKRIYICISNWNCIVFKSETNEKIEYQGRYP